MGFEAPLVFEDPHEWEQMKKEVPSAFQKDFEQGLLDRFAWKGRNLRIEGL